MSKTQNQHIVLAGDNLNEWLRFITSELQIKDCDDIAKGKLLKPTPQYVVATADSLAYEANMTVYHKDCNKFLTARAAFDALTIKHNENLKNIAPPDPSTSPIPPVKPTTPAGELSNRDAIKEWWKKDSMEKGLIG